MKRRFLSIMLAGMLALSSAGVFAEEELDAETNVEITEDNQTEDKTNEDNQTDDNQSEDNPNEENSNEDNSNEDTSNEDNTTEDNPPADNNEPSVGLMTEEMIILRDNIAEKIKDTQDGWTAFDMAAYEKIDGTMARMSAETKEAIIKAYIAEALAEDTTVSDRARIELVLKAIGIDSSELYGEGQTTPFDNAKALRESDLTSGGYYAASWILLANLQGNLNLTEEQISTLIVLLNENSKDGTFGYEWEGIAYADYDTASVVITALISMYEENEAAKEMIDAVKESLEENIMESGSFGSANTDAMVIIAYLAMGENPANLKNETSGKTVIDGLLTYVNEANDGFTFWGENNYLATEQAFRALTAMSLYIDDSYNIYDFSDTETIAGGEKPAEEEPEGEKKPHRGGGGSSRDDEDEEQPEDTENKEQTEELNENKLAEDTEKLNFSDTKGHWGSEAIDYVAKKGIMKGVGEDFFAPDEKTTRAEVVVMLHRLDGESKTDATVSFADVEDESWFKDAVIWATENGIAKGSGDGTFGAGDKINREQFVVFIYRFAKKTEETGEDFHSEEEISPWAYDAFKWAKNNGIINGRENGELAPKENITRAEAAAIFMRFLELAGE